MNNIHSEDVLLYWLVAKLDRLMSNVNYMHITEMRQLPSNSNALFCYYLCEAHCIGIVLPLYLYEGH